MKRRKPTSSFMVCLSSCASQFMLICVSQNINVCHCLCLFIADKTGEGCACVRACVRVCVCVCVCVWQSGGCEWMKCDPIKQRPQPPFTPQGHYNSLCSQPPRPSSNHPSLKAWTPARSHSHYPNEHWQPKVSLAATPAHTHMNTHTHTRAHTHTHTHTHTQCLIVLFWHTHLGYGCFSLIDLITESV